MNKIETETSLLQKDETGTPPKSEDGEGGFFPVRKNDLHDKKYKSSKAGEWLLQGSCSKWDFLISHQFSKVGVGHFSFLVPTLPSNSVFPLFILAVWRVHQLSHWAAVVDKPLSIGGGSKLRILFFTQGLFGGFLLLFLFFHAFIYKKREMG